MYLMILSKTENQSDGATKMQSTSRFVEFLYIYKVSNKGENVGEKSGNKEKSVMKTMQYLSFLFEPFFCVFTEKKNLLE